MYKKAKHKRIYVEDPNFHRLHDNEKIRISGDKREPEPKHDIMYRVRQSGFANLVKLINSGCLWLMMLT